MRLEGLWQSILVLVFIRLEGRIEFGHGVRLIINQDLPILDVINTRGEQEAVISEWGRKKEENEVTDL